MKIPRLPVAALLSLASVAAAGEETLRVRLRPREIPPESWSAVVRDLGDETVGLVFRRVLPAKGSRNTPEGWDFLFLPAAAGADPRVAGWKMALRGKGREVSGMALWREPDPPSELELLAEVPLNTDEVLRAFGPVALPDAAPAVALHLSGDGRGAEFRIRVVPRLCLAGATSLEGRTVLLALLDRDLDGRCDEVCGSAPAEGDLFLVDDDGDGRFRIEPRGPESSPLLPFLPIAGRHRRVRLEGMDLVLDGREPEPMRLRFDGLSAPCWITGWSQATGRFAGGLDAHGAVELPRARFALHSYVMKRDGWELRSLSTTGIPAFLGNRSRGVPPALLTVDPPPEGDPAPVPAGGALRCEIKASRTGDDVSFSYRFLDQGGRVVQLAGAQGIVRPAIVVFGANGDEVFRSSDWRGCG